MEGGREEKKKKLWKGTKVLVAHPQQHGLLEQKTGTPPSHGGVTRPRAQRGSGWPGGQLLEQSSSPWSTHLWYKSFNVHSLLERVQLSLDSQRDLCPKKLRTTALNLREFESQLITLNLWPWIVTRKDFYLRTSETFGNVPAGSKNTWWTVHVHTHRCQTAPSCRWCRFCPRWCSSTTHTSVQQHCLHSRLLSHSNPRAASQAQGEQILYPRPKPLAGGATSRTGEATYRPNI